MSKSSSKEDRKKLCMRTWPSLYQCLSVEPPCRQALLTHSSHSPMETSQDSRAAPYRLLCFQPPLCKRSKGSTKRKGSRPYHWCIGIVPASMCSACCCYSTTKELLLTCKTITKARPLLLLPLPIARNARLVPWSLWLSENGTSLSLFQRQA